MKNTFAKKQTRAEEAYIRDMARTSALKKVDRGQARILPAGELPEPLRRFAARKRSAVAAAVASSTHDFVAKCTAMALDMLRLPPQHVWVDYDREADVLYMSFRKPQGATKTIEVGDDILVRKDGRTIVGLTILNASAKRRRMTAKSGQPRLSLPTRQRSGR